MPLENREVDLDAPNCTSDLGGVSECRLSDQHHCRKTGCSQKYLNPQGVMQTLSALYCIFSNRRHRSRLAARQAAVLILRQSRHSPEVGCIAAFAHNALQSMQFSNLKERLAVIEGLH